MTEPPVDRPLAAIDIGTNSIHLVLARPTGRNRFETITTDKEMVRLGSGSGDMKTLQPDAIDRAVAALDRYRRLAEASGADLRAVATSAVREAENQADFLRRARDEAGVDVEVVSGAEEARLIHLGVLQAVPVFDRRLLLIDIGGGSTEFVVGERGVALDARSVKLGAIRLTDRFFRDEPLKPRRVDVCRAYVQAYLASVVRVVRRHGFEVAVGSSGTILSVATMALARRGDTGRVASNVAVTRDEVAAVVADLVAAPTVKERQKVPGLESKRADIILAGAVLLEQAMEVLGIEEIVTSDYALREGLLLDTLQRAEAASLHHLGAIREHGVRHLADLVPDERAHGEQSRRLALALFDATADRHGLGEEERELLEAAALLANVGLVISHSRHHLHSYYVIRNAEHLTGFTEREVELIAQVARYHRKSAPKAKHEAFAHLDPDDQQAVRTLAGILRVAVALDRSYEGVVTGIRTRRDDDAVVVTVQVVGDASLELFTAEERKDLLVSVLGTDIRFESSPAG